MCQKGISEYEHVATAHKGCGFWYCHLKESFDQLTIFKEL